MRRRAVAILAMAGFVFGLGWGIWSYRIELHHWLGSKQGETPSPGLSGRQKTMGPSVRIGSAEKGERFSTTGRENLDTSAPGHDATAEDLRKILRTNPRQALDCALSWGRPGDERIGLVSDLLALWARSDPERAWAWVREHFAAADPDNPGVPGATPLLQALAAHDFRLAVSYADTARALSPGNDATQACYAAVVALVTTGRAQDARAAVETWLSDPQRGAVNGASVTLVALALSRSESPSKVGDWLMKLPAGPGAYGEAASLLASTWAERDPLGALKWAQSLPVARIRMAATERAFAVLADHNAVGAADWFLAHEGQSWSDRLIPIFLQQSQLARIAPETAADWAALANDPAARARAQAVIDASRSP